MCSMNDDPSMFYIPVCKECGELLTVGNDTEPTHVFCDICDKAEHPADMTVDWNGETGQHISCENLSTRTMMNVGGNRTQNV